MINKPLPERPRFALAAPSAARARGRRDGFTLVESMLAISLTSIAGVTVMMGLVTSLKSADSSIEQLVAAGLAQLYLDEIGGKRYCEPGTSPQTAPPLGPGSPEIAALGRTQYDDMDDYNGVSNQPPRDTWNIEYGQDDGAGGNRHPNFRLPTGYFNDYRVECAVYYVSSTNLTTALTGSATSNYRAIHARAYVSEPNRGERKVIDLRRVVGYVPSL